MDIEQVNAIGTLLADLSARTEQLPGYLGRRPQIAAAERGPRRAGNPRGVERIYARPGTGTRGEGSGIRRMFSNPADPLNTCINIQAGAGGIQACDWTSMLLQQHLKNTERKVFTASLEGETPGDVAGTKSATIQVDRQNPTRSDLHPVRLAVGKLPSGLSDAL